MSSTIKMTAWIAVLAFGLLAAPAARAGTFTVTSPGDTPFPPVGTKPCSTTPASCTLRAAIVEGNNSAGPHTITFAVPKVTLSNGGGLALMAPFIITGNAALRTIVDGGGNACFSLTDATSTLNPKGANGTVISFLSIQQRLPCLHCPQSRPCPLLPHCLLCLHHARSPHHLRQIHPPRRPAAHR